MKLKARILQPWWDILYSYCLLALLGLGVISLLVPTYLQKPESQVENRKSRHDEQPILSAEEESHLRLTTSLFRSVSYRRKRSLTDEQVDELHQRYQGTSKRHNSPTEPSTSSTIPAYLEAANPEVPPEITTEQLSSPRSGKSSTLVDSSTPGEDAKPSTVKAQLNAKSAESLDEITSGIFSLITFGCLFLIEAAYNRLFYSNQLTQTIVQMVESLTNQEKFKTLQYGIIFANSLNHSGHSKDLWNIFWIHNLLRLTLTILAAVFVANLHVTSSSSFYPIHILEVFILLIQVGIASISTFWPFLVSMTSWGNLMNAYAKNLDKIDVARGRCIPAPPYSASSPTTATLSRQEPRWQSASRFSMSASVEYLATGLGLGVTPGQVERVIEAANPYTTNRNLRLLLDLVALRMGLGTALKCLSYLERDVHENWRPFRAMLAFFDRENRGVKSLELTWCNPLAVLYLNPVPDYLKLRFGIEIEFRDSFESNRDMVVDVISYKETKYFHLMGHRIQDDARRDSHQGDLSEDCFTYREVFPRVTDTQGPFKLSLWTIVDGQLTAKTVLYHGGGHQHVGHRPPPPPPTSVECLSYGVNLLPKPPRIHRASIAICSEANHNGTILHDELDVTQSENQVGDSDGEIELRDLSGEEKVFWKKSTKHDEGDLEPICIEAEPTTHHRSIVVSQTPSDSSLSTEEEDRQYTPTIVGEKRKKFFQKKIDKKWKTKSLTSLKFEGGGLKFGRRCQEYAVSSKDNLETPSGVEAISKSRTFLRKAKSTGNNLVNQLTCIDFGAVKENLKKEKIVNQLIEGSLETPKVDKNFSAEYINQGFKKDEESFYSTQDECASKYSDFEKDDSDVVII